MVSSSCFLLFLFRRSERRRRNTCIGIVIEIGVFFAWKSEGYIHWVWGSVGLKKTKKLRRSKGNPHLGR